MVSTACEACRVAKIKCRPSEQPGVCSKCLESKRECISRTCPRTRRKRSQLPGSASKSPLPPINGPSKTFCIDFDVQSPPEVGESFDELRCNHAQFMEDILPAEPNFEFTNFASPPTTSSETPSSHSHPIQSLQTKPQFNLDSAGSLLSSFRGMLPHFPCITLQPEDTVSSLAASRPFVLLAILAVASGSRTLQGHGLYDEEFRKVLGLKVVSGGEKSIQLLQGMLIYCAWYPFHLRPRNRQAYQYVRMAGDMIHDMELDQEWPELNGNFHSMATKEQLDRVRTYLSWYCIMSSSMPSWKKMDVRVPFTAWTATCCDTLQGYAEDDGDLALSYLARSASYINAAKEAIYKDSSSSEHQRQLVLFGLDAQSRELQQCMPPHIAHSVKLSELFFGIYLTGGPILGLGQPKKRPPVYIPLSMSKLKSCVTKIRMMLDFVTGLEESVFTAFTCNDWLKFITAIIAAFRLSFSLDELPGWNDSWARGVLRLDDFLSHMCGASDLTTVNSRVDASSASRVVLRIVLDKYNRRIALHSNAAVAATPEMALSTSIQGCPMFDHSMGPYITAWDTGFDMDTGMLPATDAVEEPQNLFNDWWSTMTTELS